MQSALDVVSTTIALTDRVLGLLTKLLLLCLQQVQHYARLQTGLAPFRFGDSRRSQQRFQTAHQGGSADYRIRGRSAQRGGSLLVSFIQVDTSYWPHLAPAMFFLAQGVRPRRHCPDPGRAYNTASQEGGIASALLNSAQQIGVALGLAVQPPSSQVHAGTVTHSLDVPARKSTASYGAWVVNSETGRNPPALLAQDQEAAQDMRDHLVRVGIDNLAGYVTSLEGLPPSCRS